MRIKHRSKLFAPLIFFTVLLILTACGGGGKGEEDAIVKTAKVTIGIQRIDNTQGSNVGSVDLKITLPAAFVLPTEVPLVTELKIQVSNYSHPTLTLLLTKEDVTAFPTGNLISFTQTLQSGEALPLTSDFQLELNEVSEISGNGDVTIQTLNYGATLTIEEI